MNDFNTDLQYSIDKNKDSDINSFYYKLFPCVKMIETVIDMERQKKGIDKVIHFGNGNFIYVDEKRRRKDYGDILLEEYSNFENKKVGWLGREKYTDYIVYIIETSNKIYLLPFILLQKAWIKNYTFWLTTFGRKMAINKNYTTSNIPVPTEILLSAISDQMESII